MIPAVLMLKKMKAEYMKRLIITYDVRSNRADENLKMFDVKGSPVVLSVINFFSNFMKSGNTLLIIR